MENELKNDRKKIRKKSRLMEYMYLTGYRPLPPPKPKVEAWVLNYKRKQEHMQRFHKDKETQKLYKRMIKFFKENR